METNRQSLFFRNMLRRGTSLVAGATLLAALALSGSGITGATAAVQGAGAAPPPTIKCATADLNQSELSAVEQEVRARSGYKSAGAPKIAGSYVINVYFHVVTSATGEGQVSDARISQQMRALNTGFQGTGLSFVLAGVDRTANTTWFNMGYNSQAEKEPRRRYARGAAMTSIGTRRVWRLPGLGTGPTIPEPAIIGRIVVAYDSLPGGAAVNYNEAIPPRTRRALGRPVPHLPDAARPTATTLTISGREDPGARLPGRPGYLLRTGPRSHPQFHDSLKTLASMSHARPAERMSYYFATYRQGR